MNQNATDFHLYNLAPNPTEINSQKLGISAGLEQNG